jgi:alpha-N-acetylglucosamine transferase
LANTALAPVQVESKSELTLTLILILNLKTRFVTKRPYVIDLTRKIFDAENDQL